ncbi:MAG: siphovirus Gp157 family protein [Rhodothermales bacterium]
MSQETRRTLFEISNDLLALYDRLEDLGGDVTSPEVEQTIDAWFEQLGRERDEKLDNYAALIRELEARAEARKHEARRLTQRARRDADHAAYLKQRLVLFFQDHHLKTVETRRYRLTLQRSGGKRPVVLTLDPEELPEEFQRWKVSADLDAIREALEHGATLDFAELGERGHSLRIS